MVEREQNALLDYWFGDLIAGFPQRSRNKLWFGGGLELDIDIEQRFAALVVQALAGELDSWVTASERSLLALILLLDQFPRHIYRRRAQAFAGAGRAEALVSAALAQGRDGSLQFIERVFLYMPLQHAESPVLQNRGVDAYNGLLTEVVTAGCSAQQIETVAASLDSARQHRQIVVSFGRFPHRNAALARISTAQEQSYLNAGGQRFGQ